MGYTTKFEGQFKLSKLPPAEVIVKLRALEDSGDDGVLREGAPDGYCQWQLTKDCMGIEWDGGEKFYDYQEWLQWIIDTILKPAKISLKGEVHYAGEDVKDRGVLSIDVNEVKKTEQAAISDELEDLKAFRDFVLEHDRGDELLSDWLDSRR